MSGGPIDRARRARVTLTTDPAAVTCSDCLAALAADEQAASSRRA